MNAAPQKLSKLARLWMMCGRIASPITAPLAWVLGLIIRSKRMRAGASGILTGKISLAGPSVRIQVASGRSVRPGLFNDATLSNAMNLELDSMEMDQSYIAKLGPKKDLSLVLKGLLTEFFHKEGGSVSEDTDHFNLFGVIVNNSETPRLLKTLNALIQAHPNLILKMLPEAQTAPEKPIHVTFVNANNFNLAMDNPNYLNVLRDSNLVLPDGIGVKLALQMAGGRLRKNLNGTDLLPHLAEMFSENEWPVFLLGATDQVLERASHNLNKKFPTLKIAGTRNGYFKKEDERDICRQINESGAVALIIGMGSPRQELFAARNAKQLRLPVVLSMGGLIDFLGEKNKRAPLWMRQIGLEWVFRLLQEPGRMWKRYIIGNPVFLWRTRKWIQSKRVS